MRLLNSITRKLEVFADNQIPQYAILSHTWGDDEVSFQEMQQALADSKAGIKKIKFACAQAADEGWLYVWVDTACIDKSSSAELSEAINSMYRWYQKAEICYAYLSDVPAGDDPEAKDSAFAKSKWFTRGWTLQELIAPSNFVFYSEDWTRIGSRIGLRKILWRVTQIDGGLFEGASPNDFSIAQRMSWASRRTTTRVEDMAYCLLGIFDVNMALLYGEGERSFKRLQEEIMTTSDDHSLFAWRAEDSDMRTHRGLLATSPAEFRDAGTIFPYRDASPTSIPYSMTNKGLRITLNLGWPRVEPFTLQNLRIATLDCAQVGSFNKPVGILLRPHSSIGDQYCRVYPKQLLQIDAHSSSPEITFQSETKTIYASEKISVPEARHSNQQQSFWIRNMPLSNHRTMKFSLSKVTAPANSPIRHEEDSTGVKLPISNDTNGWVAGLLFKQLASRKPYHFYLLLGYTLDFGVSIRIENYLSNESVQDLFVLADARDSSVLKYPLRDDSKTFIIHISLDVLRIPQKVRNLDIPTDCRVIPAQKIYALDIQIHDAL